MPGRTRTRSRSYQGVDDDGGPLLRPRDGALGAVAPIWLLDLEGGPAVLRYASEPVTLEPTVGTGERLVYLGGLGDVEASESDEGALGRSVDLTLPAEAWDQVVPGRRLLEGARATLRRWVPGQRLDEARTVCRASPGLSRGALRASRSRSGSDLARARARS